MDKSKEQTNKPESKLCIKCNKFWGSPANQDMCSKCCNDLKKKEGKVEANSKEQKSKTQDKKEQTEVKITKGTTKGIQQNKGRCFTCKKKVGLLGIECKCGYVHCNTHRLPEDHECDFNHEEAGKDKLKKQIIKVQHAKISTD